MITKKKIETIKIFRDRNPKFVNKETLHSIELYDEKLNKIVPIEIISKQHSINGDVQIFLNVTPVIDDYYVNDCYELKIFKYLNSYNNNTVGISLRNYIFINTDKLPKDKVQLFLIHELQHSFDFYNGLLSPFPSLIINPNLCDFEYRAFLAELVFSNVKDVKNIYMEIRKNALSFEKVYYNPFLKFIGYHKCYINKRNNPHDFAGLRIIKELEEIKENELISKSLSKFEDKIKPKELIEKSKILLDNDYRRLTGRSYDELFEDFSLCQKCN